MVKPALENLKSISIPGAFPIIDTTEPTTSTGHTLPGGVISVFTSLVYHYITPNLYTEFKPTICKGAPTWNHAAVRVTTYHDTEDEQTELILQQLGDLTQLGEEGLIGFQNETGSSLGSNVKHEGDGSGTGNMDGDPPYHQNLSQKQSPDLEKLHQGVKTAPTGASGHGNASALPESWKITHAPREYITSTLLRFQKVLSG
ncbi:FMN-binding split barrel-related protein [Penicillium coprophilum]|uniref:FMN-binding split barrel-related protein n=1 Tax=Penicillium coprophilum TaxID=36646 RepID=UPI00239A368B|nr:FMN-binding split barrel-related protein [Penicillium coprophilum]KAJ5150654.1 FMN-binding split barrel-related protein [Penicillium coprophilum]